MMDPIALILNTFEMVPNAISSPASLWFLGCVYEWKGIGHYTSVYSPKQDAEKCFQDARPMMFRP